MSYPEYLLAVVRAAKHREAALREHRRVYRQRLIYRTGDLPDRRRFEVGDKGCPAPRAAKPECILVSASESVHLNKLFPSQKYDIDNVAKNNVGRSSAVVAATLITSGGPSIDSVPETVPVAPIPVPLNAIALDDKSATITWYYDKSNGTLFQPGEEGSPTLGDVWLGGAIAPQYVASVRLHIATGDCVSEPLAECTAHETVINICDITTEYPAGALSWDKAGNCDVAAKQTFEQTSLSPGWYTAYVTILNKAGLVSDVPMGAPYRRSFYVMNDPLTPKTPVPESEPEEETVVTWTPTDSEAARIDGYVIEWSEYARDASGACTCSGSPVAGTTATLSVSGASSATATLPTTFGRCYGAKITVDAKDGDDTGDVTGDLACWVTKNRNPCPISIKKIKHLPIARTNFLGTVPECDGGSPLQSYRFVIKNLSPGTEGMKICRKRAPGQLKFGLPSDTATSDSGFGNECWDYFTPGYTYAVSAIVHNEAGGFAQSKWVPFRTPLTGPGRSPSPFGAKPLYSSYNPSTQSMTVQMNTTLQSWFAGGFNATIDESSVELSIWETKFFGSGKKASVCTRSSVVSQTSSTWSCSELKYNVEYAAAIQGRNSEGLVSPIDKYTVMRFAPPPVYTVIPVPLSSIKFALTRVNAVNVSWVPVAGDVIGYTLHAIGASSACPSTSATTSSTWAVLSDLGVDCNYRFGIVTNGLYADYGSVSPPTNSTFWTAGPVALTSTKVATDRISITWNAKPTVTGSTSNKGGVVYQVFYQVIGDAAQVLQSVFVTNPAGSSTSISLTITGLAAGRVYALADEQDGCAAAVAPVVETSETGEVEAPADYFIPSSCEAALESAGKGVLELTVAVLGDSSAVRRRLAAAAGVDIFAAGPNKELRTRGLTILSARALAINGFGVFAVNDFAAGPPSMLGQAPAGTAGSSASSGAASSGASVGVIVAAVAGAVAVAAVAIVAVVYRRFRKAHQEVILKAAYAGEPVGNPTPPGSQRGSFDFKSIGVPSLHFNVAGDREETGPETPASTSSNMNSRRPSSAIDIGDIGNVCPTIELPRHAVAHAAGIRSRSWREEGRRASVVAQRRHVPRAPGSAEAVDADADADGAGRGRSPHGRSFKLSVPPRAEDLPPTARPDQVESYRMA
eukprot:tig00020553_g10700.t1